MFLIYALDSEFNNIKETCDLVIKSYLDNCMDRPEYANRVRFKLVETENDADFIFTFDPKTGKDNKIAKLIFTKRGLFIKTKYYNEDFNDNSFAFSLN